MGKRDRRGGAAQEALAPGVRGLLWLQAVARVRDKQTPLEPTYTQRPTRGRRPAVKIYRVVYTPLQKGTRCERQVWSLISCLGGR